MPPKQTRCLGWPMNVSWQRVLAEAATIPSIGILEQDLDTPLFLHIAFFAPVVSWRELL